jgi:hypothetical protein
MVTDKLSRGITTWSLYKSVEKVKTYPLHKFIWKNETIATGAILKCITMILTNLALCILINIYENQCYTNWTVCPG